MTSKPIEKKRLTRDQKRAERAADLVSAAWALFCEKGYDDTSLEDVAALAGCSRMPIYSMFGDKQTLYFEVWRRFSTDLAQAMLAACAKDAPLTQNLAALAQIVGNTESTLPPLHGESLFFVVQGISLGRPDIKDGLKKLANDQIRAFAEMIDASSLPEGKALHDKPEVVAQHLIAQINGASMVQFQTGQPFARQQMLLNIFCAIALTEKV